MSLKLDYTFNLLGFNPETNSLYVLKTGQYGAESRILGLIVIDLSTKKYKELLKNESYQYASISPDGQSCLFVDGEVYIYDFNNNKMHKVIITESLDNTEADPFREKGGGTVGGSANLSGEFMYMQWKSNNSGYLILRNLKRKIIKKIEIK